MFKTGFWETKQIGKLEICFLVCVSEFMLSFPSLQPKNLSKFVEQIEKMKGFNLHARVKWVVYRNVGVRV